MFSLSQSQIICSITSLKVHRNQAQNELAWDQSVSQLLRAGGLWHHSGWVVIANKWWSVTLSQDISYFPELATQLLAVPSGAQCCWSCSWSSKVYTSSHKMGWRCEGSTRSFRQSFKILATEDMNQRWGEAEICENKIWTRSWRYTVEKKGELAPSTISVCPSWSQEHAVSRKVYIRRHTSSVSIVLFSC